MPATEPLAPRPENRRQRVLEAAASRFLRHGYSAASMRDIAADAGMQVGSIYYHFPSKADLLTAVHQEGLRRIKTAVTEALSGRQDPWERLEWACITHMEVLLHGGDFFQTVMRELPRETDPDWKHLVALRDDYEAIFTGLLDALTLPADMDRRKVRLMLLGAMNYSPMWYRSGDDAPANIARNFIEVLRRGLEPGAP